MTLFSITIKNMIKLLSSVIIRLETKTFIKPYQKCMSNGKDQITKFASITAKLVFHLRGSKVYVESSSPDLTSIHGNTPNIIKIFKTMAKDRNKTLEFPEFCCIVFVFISKCDWQLNIDVNDSAVKHSSKNNPFLSLEARSGELQSFKKKIVLFHVFTMIYSCTK